LGQDDPADQQANRILCLHVDRHGQLWLGTDGAGVLRYCDDVFTPFAEAPGAAVNCVRAIVEDASGHFWLGTKGGVGQLRNGRLTWFTDANGFTNSPKSTWSLSLDSAGRLWAADWSNLRVFDGATFDIGLSRLETRTPLRTLYTNAAGQLWAGMQGRAMVRETNGQWTRLDEPGEFGNSEVTAFCQTCSGEVWVGTRRGLYHLREGRWTTFSTREGLASSEVRVLFEDREKNLWVGTGTGGLARLKRRVLKTYTARHGLTDGRVLALREKPAGGLWVGLHDGRMVHTELGISDRFERLKDFPADAAVSSVLRTSDNSLWVGTFGNGLVRFRGGETNSFVPSDGTPNRTDKITALLEDRNGVIWVGTFYALYKVAGINRLIPVPVGRPDVRGHVTALLQDKAGAIWVAYHGLGIVRLSGDNAMWLTRREGLPTGLIRALHEDAASRIWIGTAAGLCCWEEGTINTFTKAHGLADENISQILEDDSGHLWLGSNRGIMRMSVSELIAVADRRKSSLEIFMCGLGEGMLSLECSGGFCPAGLKTRDGRLWFPTARGLVMVDPAQLKLRMNSVLPPVHIEEVWVDGNLAPKMPVGAATLRSSVRSVPMALPHRTRRLEFVYTALSLTAPERVRFKYRLEGADSDWTEAGTTRSAVYNKLPSGRYRFQVIACNNDGMWNEAGAGYSFRIAAPFWQTAWFLTSAGIVAAATLGIMVRIVSVRHLRRKLRRLEEAHAIEKERMRIAQDMHDEIGGKLSRISFLSDMARHSVPETSEAIQQIDQVSEAAREVIRTVDEIVWAVSPRNDTLESLTHYICRHAEEFFELTPVELELELPPEFPAHRLSAEVRHNLFCAVKEALNNVLKHADATRVRIAFVLNTAVFQVSVTDNGRGFPDALLKVKGNGNGTPPGPRGDGLLNMQERLQSVSGECTIESQSGQGTRAIFTVPFQ
jgi:ligand-binding sensor domain-containing protein/anti-sigma regulatory factor (Ser/Thr protein kinase)